MKKLSAMILSAVILLACGIIVPQNSAYADSRAPLTGDVYYFTDNPGCYTIQNYLIANSNFTSSTFHLVYRNSPDYTSNTFVYDIWYSYDYDLIYDSYIIFECYYEFEKIYQYSYPDYPDYLEDIFSTLKTNGCEIMFVCGTDQNRYYDYTYFLSYVDIHVETDLFYEFISNVFYYLENVYSTSPLAYYSLLFRNIIDTQVQNFVFLNDAFVREYLYDVIDEGYAEDIEQDGFEDTMNYNQLYFYSYYSGFIYNNCYLSNDSIDLSDDDVDYDNICLIGVTDPSAVTTAAWFSALVTLKEQNSAGFPLFVYDPYGHSIYSDIQNDIYVGRGPDCASVTLKEIMLDFITAEDISGYDNWSGVCDITHIMANVGPGGWMMNRGRRECLQIIQTIV